MIYHHQPTYGTEEYFLYYMYAARRVGIDDTIYLDQLELVVLGKVTWLMACNVVMQDKLKYF